MFSKRRTFNPKRRLAATIPCDNLNRIAIAVQYGGNPEHKRNPADFGLTPPASPRPDKTLCDETGIVRRKDALKLLQEGIRRGLVSEQFRNGYPQNIWAVTSHGVPLEAQLENPANATYHGYPIPENDSFREIVLEKWPVNHE